ncbi:MAG: mechanosensitive ion channel family protein [Firmicutes bacterium]|jgi:small-conductance mechanosensitive channel|nr:mechanosensitive ion channel family protein [Bacillota bacterium]
MLEKLTQLEGSGDVLGDFFIDLALTWGSRIFKGILILLLARIALGIGSAIIHRMFNSSAHPSTIAENKLKTISGLLLSLLRYVVFTITTLLLLSNLEIIDIGPILAGAGIVGLAVGFGAQNLVRDVITGFFILLEDQYAVGEYITVSNYSGIVEEVGLRITKIRGFGGELYIIPNGLIESVINWNRGKMRALVDISVPYEEDLDNVLAELEKIVVGYAAEDPDIVEGPTVLGVAAMSESAVVVRIVARTVPMAQWKVERNLRKAIKSKFAELGIKSPYPRHVVYTRDNAAEKEDLSRG